MDGAVLDQFCRRWMIAKLELFGSALREDFRGASDFDLLVTFKPDATWSLFDHEEMETELAELLGHKVDLITRRSVEASRNPIRRDSILTSAVPVFVAR
jgi:predicted nucleotidyltransferase